MRLKCRALFSSLRQMVRLSIILRCIKTCGDAQLRSTFGKRRVGRIWSRPSSRGDAGGPLSEIVPEICPVPHLYQLHAFHRMDEIVRDEAEFVVLPFAR